AWIQDGDLIGHTNINKIQYNEEAFMHLHVWPEILRRKGMGTELVKMSLPIYFDRFKLKRLYCEPNALNEPPNKTLVKAGFDFLGTEEKIPGYINFLQKVNKYVIEADKVRKQQKS
ncbi:MAG: GNAT family N-acetyltransferase, partial [Cyclobacteriaceae bacterium]|nr:GNAT family N-acetyltransferase [Cyclobacteriaceae bacterium SS2]